MRRPVWEFGLHGSGTRPVAGLARRARSLDGWRERGHLEGSAGRLPAMPLNRAAQLLNQNSAECKPKDVKNLRLKL